MTDINNITKLKSGTKEYHAIKSREWYARQPKEVKEARNKYRSVIRNKNKQVAIDYLGGKCNDCGQVFPHYVYDFHHVEQDLKSANLNKLLNCSLEKVLNEIKNCVLLCANCHRIRHKAEHNKKSRTQDEIYNLN